MSKDDTNSEGEASSGEDKNSTEEYIRQQEELRAKKGKPPTSMIAKNIEVGALVEKSKTREK